LEKIATTRKKTPVSRNDTILVICETIYLTNCQIKFKKSDVIHCSKNTDYDWPGDHLLFSGSHDLDQLASRNGHHPGHTGTDRFYLTMSLAHKGAFNA
jgi:hypothetical protein